MGVGGGIVGRVERIDESAHRLEVSEHIGLAGAVDHGHLGRDDEAALARACAQGSPSTPAVHPAGTSRSRPVTRLIQAEVPSSWLSTGGRRSSMWPRHKRQPLRALVCLEPDAAHLGLDLAGAVRADAPARSVAQRLRTRHRARQPGRVQDALAAHLAPPDGPLDGVLRAGEQGGGAAGGGHAATRSRRRSISSFAFLTAVEASAE